MRHGARPGGAAPVFYHIARKPPRRPASKLRIYLWRSDFDSIGGMFLQTGSDGFAAEPRRAVRVRGRLRTGAAALIAVGLAIGCSGESEEDSPKKPKPPVTVEVTTVEAKPLRDVATFSGQFDAEFSVVVKAEIEGLVESIEFEEGGHVEKGDLLVRLRNDTQKALLREAIATGLLAQAEFDRTQQLVTRDAASTARRDRVVAELEVAKARIDRARADLARTELRAPFAGVVGFRTVNPGDSIDENVPIVRIDAIDRLQLSFSTSDHAVAIAHAGMPVEARVAPYPGAVFPGRGIRGFSHPRPGHAAPGLEGLGAQRRRALAARNVRRTRPGSRSPRIRNRSAGVGHRIRSPGHVRLAGDG